MKNDAVTASLQTYCSQLFLMMKLCPELLATCLSSSLASWKTSTKKLGNLSLHWSSTSFRSLIILQPSTTTRLGRVDCIPLFIVPIASKRIFRLQTEMYLVRHQQFMQYPHEQFMRPTCNCSFISMAIAVTHCSLAPLQHQSTCVKLHFLGWHTSKANIELV